MTNNFSTKMPRVYIVGGGFAYIKMFFDLGFLGARGIQEADLICFTGGEDVDPQLYGESPLAKTNFNTQRDEKEQNIYLESQVQRIPMIGICRGAQFLNVMNSGKLWQHVNNHTSCHELTDLSYKEEWEVTSTHHQQMIPSNRPETMVLAVANESTEKYSFGKEQLIKNRSKNLDVEVIWYTDTQCLCFQPHPEIGHKPTYKYFSKLLDDWILPIL